MMGSMLRSIARRLVPDQRRADVRVAAYCSAYGVDQDDDT